MENDIDKKKMFRMMAWFAVPLIVVLLISAPYTFGQINILQEWFGIKTDIGSWINHAIYGSLLLMIVGVIITIIRFKAWSQFSYTRFKPYRFVLWAILVLMYVIWRLIESYNRPY